MTGTITERIHDPIHHVSYSFRREGGSLWVSTWLEDGGHLPEHFHPSLEEHWEVLDGAVRVKLDGAWRDLVPAHGRVLVAPYVRHELANVSGRDVSRRSPASLAAEDPDQLASATAQGSEQLADLGEPGAQLGVADVDRPHRVLQLREHVIGLGDRIHRVVEQPLHAL